MSNHTTGAGKGTALVGVDISTGVESCRSNPLIREPGFVGLGQSLSYDGQRDRLVISGVVGPNSTGGFHHQILTLSLGQQQDGYSQECGTFIKAGSFGIAKVLPITHSSAYDELTQTLYLTVSPNKTLFALAIFDLADQTMISVDIEDKEDKKGNRLLLYGMCWNADTGHLIGLMQNFGSGGDGGVAQDGNGHGVNLMAFDPKTLEWTVRPLQNLGRPNWDVNGNNGM